MHDTIEAWRARLRARGVLLGLERVLVLLHSMLAVEQLRQALDVEELEVLRACGAGHASEALHPVLCTCTVIVSAITPASIHHLRACSCTSPSAWSDAAFRERSALSVLLWSERLSDVISRSTTACARSFAHILL